MISKQLLQISCKYCIVIAFLLMGTVLTLLWQVYVLSTEKQKQQDTICYLSREYSDLNDRFFLLDDLYQELENEYDRATYLLEYKVDSLSCKLNNKLLKCYEQRINNSE